jgi:hypothetical protein
MARPGTPLRLLTHQNGTGGPEIDGAYQHQEPDPLRDAINERNRERKERKKQPAVSKIGHNKLGEPL